MTEKMEKYKFRVEITGYVIDTKPLYALQRVQHGISICAGIMNGPTETKATILEESNLVKPNGKDLSNFKR